MPTHIISSIDVKITLKRTTISLQKYVKHSYIQRGNNIIIGTRMIDVLNPLLVSLGVGGLGGFLIGFATKKIIKFLMVILGLYLLSLFYLMHIEVININITKLLENSSNIITQLANFLSSTI